MEFKKIVVPFDGSKYSVQAFKTALNIAKKFDSQISVISYIDTQAWYYRYFDARMEKNLLKKQRKYLDGEIAKLREIAIKQGIDFKHEIKETVSIGKQILSYTNSHNFDLIVMGSHGKSGINKIILGSVANEVAQNAKLPILIVKKK